MQLRCSEAAGKASRRSTCRRFCRADGRMRQKGGSGCCACHAGDACAGAAGDADQRAQVGQLCGDHQEPAFGHHAAAGGWQPDEDSGEVGRHGEVRRGVDADRPAEAAGDGGGAAGHRAATSGPSTSTTRATSSARRNYTRTASSPSRRTTRRCRRSRTPRRRWIRRRRRPGRSANSLRTTRFARRLTELWATSRSTWATTSRRVQR